MIKKIFEFALYVIMNLITSMIIASLIVTGAKLNLLGIVIVMIVLPSVWGYTITKATETLQKIGDMYFDNYRRRND